MTRANEGWPDLKWPYDIGDGGTGCIGDGGSEFVGDGGGGCIGNGGVTGDGGTRI